MSITMVSVEDLEARLEECLQHDMYQIEKNILLWASSNVVLSVYRTRKNAYLSYVFSYAYEQFHDIIMEDSDMEAMVNRVLTFIASLVFEPLTENEEKQYEENITPYYAFSNGDNWYCPSCFLDYLSGKGEKESDKYEFMRFIAYGNEPINHSFVHSVIHEDSIQYETDHSDIEPVYCHMCTDLLYGSDSDDDF